MGTGNNEYRRIRRLLSRDIHGRAVAVGLMAVGIGLLAGLAGMMAGGLIRKVTGSKDVTNEQILAAVNRLEERIHTLETKKQ